MYFTRASMSSHIIQLWLNLLNKKQSELGLGYQIFDSFFLCLICHIVQRNESSYLVIRLYFCKLNAHQNDMLGYMFKSRFGLMLCLHVVARSPNYTSPIWDCSPFLSGLRGVGIGRLLKFSSNSGESC